jgi:plastocyanin
MNRIKSNEFVNYSLSAFALLTVLMMVFFGVSALSALDTKDGAGATQGAPATEVTIDNFAFTPGVITVKAGTEVTWVNHDDIPHTVDSTQGKFKSEALDTGEQFKFRFTDPGEYPFYCRIHPKMTGKIIVQP